MPVRVIACGFPRLLKDVVSVILAADPDLVVVFMRGDDDIAAAVRHQQADAVLLHGSYPTDSRNLAALLASRREVRVLTLAGHGGALYLLGEQRVLRRRPSAAQLLRAVRGQRQVGRENLTRRRRAPR
jgi:hypothetical protein